MSYYSQEPSNPRIFAEKGGYNLIHVYQLLWLYDITQDSVFLKKAIRFYGYELEDNVIKTKGSVDPVNHGPDKLNLTFGLNYWSHNDFPTWVEIDLNSIKEIKGMSILGHTAESAPKDMDIWQSSDKKEWNLIEQVRGNTEKNYLKYYDQPIVARYFKIDILSDNGNENVALDGIGFITQESASHITNFHNFSSGNLPVKALDNDMDTKFYIKEDGWLLLDVTDKEIIKKMNISTGVTEKSAYIQLFGSNDLNDWINLGKYLLDNETSVIELKENTQYNFLKIDFSTDLRWINDISF